ncbi:MAG: hypothetical protein ACI4J0_06990 [Huintestinicola sp.]|uniref:hypothetical protein n=1 Tax=Huintestinicola sp. TaxID=2981661 RepID=UPI003F0686D4
MMKLKKLFTVLSLITALSLSACAGAAESDGESGTVPETARNENVPSDDFARAEEDIGNCMSSLIMLNSDENTVSVSSEDIFGASSEGGELTRFTDEKGTLLRVRSVLFGSVGSVEINYYILREGRGYYTVLEKHNDSAQLGKTDGVLYYGFNEYYIDGDSFFIIDRIAQSLIPCEDDPVSAEIKKLLGGENT